MKSILISIQPKWCELIALGKKTVEVRKTRPKIETPFKVYIYRTKGFVRHLCNNKWCNMPVGGEVIGEFVCDKVVKFENSLYDPVFDETSALSCVRVEELNAYIGKKNYGYGWHISNLEIYDKSKKLSGFCRNGECARCGWFEDSKCLKRDEQNKINKHRVKRPPQSWCYVAEAQKNQ